MSLQRSLHFTVCFAIILCSTSAFAQKEFGSAQGTIQDGEKQPIPGAGVIVTSDLRGSTTVYTDKNGRYRLESLIPGTYQLEVRLAGFQSVLKRDIQISVGRTNVADFVLKPKNVGESITVQGEAPLVDSTTPAFSYTIPPEVIQGLPESHFRELLSLVPGVGDDIVAYGSSITSNRLWIDGVDISSRSNGGIFVDYNYNWIEEVQVVGIGAPAEYGNYAGVIGNFVTRSGGNQFHGLVETFFHNQNLVSTNVPSSAPEIPFKSWDLTAQIGGPMIHNTLWFFSGFQYPYTQSSPFGYDDVATNEYPKFLTKITYKPNQNNTIQGFGHYNYSRLDGEGAGVGVLPEATLVNTCHESSWNATWISLVTTATTLEGRFGGIWGACNFLPRNGNTPARFNADTRLLSENARYTTKHRRFQPQGNFAVTHYAEQFLGEHEFKFGVQFQNAGLSQEHSINGGFIYYNYLDSTYNFRYSYLQNTTRHNGDIDQVSLYVQDTWNLNHHFSLSLGLRWDHNRGSTDRGVVSSTDPVAPRIGVIWKLRENRPILIKAHYGDYYDALLTRQFVFLSDQQFGYLFEELDSSSQQWEKIDGGQQVYLSAPDTRHPFIRQFTVGMDQEFPAEIAAGVHYIYRRWHNILEDIDLNSVYELVPFVNPVTGELITVYSRVPSDVRYTLLTNPEGLYRKYDGLEVYVNRRFRNHLALSAAFAYSKTTGNIPNSREIFSSGFTEFLNDANSFININGHLINDPTYAWKFSGVYNFPNGLNLGWFFRHQSGDTWQPLVSLGNKVNQPGITIFGLPRGSYKLPSQNILDLRIEKQFAVMTGLFRITADIFNVMNAGTVTGVNQFWDSTRYGQPTSFVEPRQIRLGLRYTF